ncbi:hypothetical protein C6P46_001425 [Rhodotorula mucilaginosa]|uniref:chitin synthase n=1 Tax=Rhodotorula mucilaginosa TaxID=5537 RepID=A0A9P6W583_RHOMI|nr:hypothetical protein C6P46_001425 [Rhodotorula mucilaginosa]
MAAGAAAGDPHRLADLTHLVSSSSGTGVVAIPSPDSLTHAIAQRYRLDLTATYAGHATLVVVNPLEPKADMSEASKAEYEDRAYRLTPGTSGPAVDLDPHAYDLACRVYLAARRSGHAQSITYSGLSGAGASSQQHLVTAQLLRLSTSGKKDTRLAEQVSALETVLTSFGCARTASNPSATRYSSLLELHLNAHGRLAGAKVLAYGLDRTRFAKLEKGERSFHVLYQLVAGATAQERDEYALLDDPAEYALFRKSTTFRLPAGVPLADDSIAFDELRTAFKVLGFKPRHVAALYRVLSAILLLGNLDFAEHPEDAYEYQSEPAWVTNHEVLEQCAALLGVAAPDLERSLTNRVRWVRKEMMATILRADGADHQRDSLMAALYSIVFAFVVETANHRLFPGDEAITAIQRDGGTSIVQFSQPGFTNHASSRPGSRSSVLVQALNGYDDFVHNYQTELARYWAIEQAFDGDAGIAARAQEDGVRVPDVLPADDGTSRIELLRGGRIGGKADRKPGGILGGLAKTCASLRRGVQPDQADTDLVAGMRDHFAAHSSFVAHPTGPGARTSFAIQHWGNQTVAYDAYRFVETDCDAFDPEQVALLRSSSDPFVNKLVSGPALAAEVHPIDDATLVAAQVSSMPLRRPSPVQATPAFTRAEGEAEDYTAPLLDPLAIYPVSTQINATTAQLFGSILARTQQWNVISLLPNATSTPRQIDARLLKAQVAAFQLPQLVARRNTADWAVDVPYEEFLERHGLGASAHETTRDAVANYLRDFGFDDHGEDFALGNARVWLSWRVWKAVEDRLREQEPAEHRDLARENVVQARGGGGGGGGLSGEASPPKEGGGGGGGGKDSSEGSAVEGERGMLGYLPELGATRSTINVGYQEGGGGPRQSYGMQQSGSVDDLLYDAAGTPGSPNTPVFDYSNAAAGGGGGGRTQSGFFSDYTAAARPESTYAAGLQPPQAPYMYQQSGGAGGAGFPSMGSFGGYGGGGGGPGGRDSEIWGMPQGDAAAPTPAVPFTPVGARALGANKEAGVLDREGNPQEGEGKAIEEVPTSRGRRVWVALVWALTWWIPTPCLTYVGRMKRPDVRMAWREKLALCMLIAFFCGIVIFYIIVFGRLLCPNYNKAWNEKELGYHSGSDDYWVGVRGNVYDLTKFYKIQHSDIQGQPVTSTDMLTLGGLDVTHYFPIPLTSACPDLVSDQSLSLQYENFTAEVPTAVHTSGSLQPATGSGLHQDDWYFNTFLPKMRKYYKGPLVWSKGKVSDEANKAGRQWAIVNGSVYDLTDYFYTYNLLNDKSYLFLNASIANVWTAQPGTDITGAIKELGIDAPTLKTNMDCIQTLFYVGETDFRDTPRCQVQPNLLLAFSILIMLTILVKFLAALQFGSKRLPEQRDKFVICQVPCYTEGEDSLKKTIDSLATLNYDDRRKLLFIICDGMIVGSGNDRPTPRIVLDILGVDQTVEPDPLMYKAVAEGSKQLNYGKVWSGLYEVEGHVVPYIVVAKVGRPSERSRPGNRGKRDSQILVMRFLNRVHFDAEMYPLELEMYHQIKNIIGVDPQFYEFMFVIDADTSVEADSLNRLVAAATDDSQIIGICGETRLENEQVSWWTMIQVYEYFISHHMAKAFESLFGSVTCLPGCFTMFRIRSADKGKPLLVSSLIIDDYSDGNLDTLHKKNLLALGEDRYLTTLILKHFPTYKTKFIADAKAQTVAPHSWGILLSQRRRWINSTVHNLAELMFLPNMCGFCCFSMRFVVFIDLLGTIILPATFVYLVYLIVTVATGSGQIPMIAIIMIAAVYGLQAIIFLLKRQWQFIGWLIIYLIAYPVYSFLLPVYSFWRFDDFTWGNTRVVVGEGRSKKVLQAEDEAFDESTIPLARFAEYEAALAEEALDMRSEKTRSEAGFSLATRMGPTYGATNTQAPYGSRASLQMPPQGFTGYGGGGGGGPGSVVGSDFGYPASVHPYMPPATLQSQMSLAGYGGAAPQLPMSALPRRQSGMSAFTYGGAGGAPSVFSMNPFANPPPPTVSDDPNPSDEVLVSTLQAFLATQDLMQLSKRKAREGLAALFPRADLSSRKDWINEQIDRLLAP